MLLPYLLKSAKILDKIKHLSRLIALYLYLIKYNKLFLYKIQTLSNFSFIYKIHRLLLISNS